MLLRLIVGRLVSCDGRQETCSIAKYEDGYLALGTGHQGDWGGLSDRAAARLLAKCESAAEVRECLTDRDEYCDIREVGDWQDVERAFYPPIENESGRCRTCGYDWKRAREEARRLVPA